MTFMSQRPADGGCDHFYVNVDIHKKTALTTTGRSLALFSCYVEASIAFREILPQSNRPVSHHDHFYGNNPCRCVSIALAVVRRAPGPTQLAISASPRKPAAYRRINSPSVIASASPLASMSSSGRMDER